jgi:hypothetical protein
VDLSQFDQGLWFDSAVLAATIIGRIVQQHLFAPPFKSFALMLAVVVARDIVLAISGFDSKAYVLIWGWSLPVLLGVQTWAAFDTLRAVARLYPKIGNSAIRLFLGCLAITVIAGCVVVPLELHRVAGSELHRVAGHVALMRAAFLLQRCVDSWIAGTLVLVALFFARSPAPLNQPPRNLVLHTMLLSLYFGGYGVILFVKNLVPIGAAQTQTMDRIHFSAVVLLYAIWATCLSAKGQNTGPWPQVDVIVLDPLAPQGQLRRECDHGTGK